MFLQKACSLQLHFSDPPFSWSWSNMLPYSFDLTFFVSHQTSGGFQRCRGRDVQVCKPPTTPSPQLLRQSHSPYTFWHFFAFLGYEILSNSNLTLTTGSLSSKAIRKCVDVEKFHIRWKKENKKWASYGRALKPKQGNSDLMRLSVGRLKRFLSGEIRDRNGI